MPEILRFVKGLTNWVWTQRAKILVLILVMTWSCRSLPKRQFIDRRPQSCRRSGRSTPRSRTSSAPDCETSVVRWVRSTGS